MDVNILNKLSKKRIMSKLIPTQFSRAMFIKYNMKMEKSRKKYMEVNQITKSIH